MKRVQVAVFGFALLIGVTARAQTDLGTSFDPIDDRFYEYEWEVTPIYVDNVQEAFQALKDYQDGQDDRRNWLHASTPRTFWFNYPSSHHLQGIARLSQSNCVILSGNVSDEARVGVVTFETLAHRSHGLLGNNARPPADTDTTHVLTVSHTYDHAGGISSCGNIVAVPIERSGLDCCDKASEIRFLFVPPDDFQGTYDLSAIYPDAIIERPCSFGGVGVCLLFPPPTFECLVTSHDACKQLYGTYFGDGTTCPPSSCAAAGGAGAVAITRLPVGPYQDHYFVGVTTGGDGRIWFYLSRTTEIVDGFEEVSETQSNWFRRGWAWMQTINFITQPDGKIFLLGTLNTLTTGGQHDKAYLARLDFQDNDLHNAPSIIGLEDIHFDCHHEYGNFAAAAGFYVGPGGRLALYATPHSTYDESGDEYGRIIHMHEFPWAPAPPVADAGPDLAVPADESCMATVMLDGSASYDPDGNPLTYAWSWDGGSATGVSPILDLPLGDTVVTLVVHDGTADSDPRQVTVSVLDETPPLITCTADPQYLWPPNHKMVPVSISVSAFDNCDAALVSRIVSVTSNQPDVGGEDWRITGDLTVDLRAERLGSGARTYTIEVEGCDASDNCTFDLVEVVVPHDAGHPRRP